MAAIIKTNLSTGRIRVALVIESGKLKPVWFEETDKPSRERIFIKEVCSIWSHREGAAKIINFGVWDGANSYKLSLNTLAFTWQLGLAESRTFP